MVSRKLVFLLGGSAAFESVANEFIVAAGDRDARIALLMQGGEQWEKYVPDYTLPWIRRGVTRYYPIVPEENGVLELEKTSEQLRLATGIFIGGGHTPTYHQLYATEPIRGIIQESYEKGVPVAGVSAGAVIALEICVFSPDETGADAIQTISGLGLISDLVIGVHFTELNALPKVLEVMAKTHTKRGLGIDEPACAVFEDGKFAGILGRSVYEIEMNDFESKDYSITASTIAYSRCSK